MAKKPTRALLLDLDDTLLVNDMEDFVPHYFEALLARVRSVCPPDLFLEALNAGTRAMWYNDGTDGTNAEVFGSEFFPRLGRKPEEIIPLLEEFYTHDFEALRRYTDVDPHARPLVTLAFEQGYQVVIATQPIFPLSAIHARLRWAGVGVELFDYDYVTSYETMSACKPHPHFFRTLLDHLGRTPDECLMVGDSITSDMAAGRFGLKTFWVDRGRLAEPPEIACNARGTLHDLTMLLETGGIHEL